jgi:thiosulfate/3-mercaptopyruvate sulfurtransferase
MNNEILVSTERLQQLLIAGDCLVVDCRFDLSDAKKGRNDWLSGHIPGAQYAHLDDDLASPITDQSGRHPIPEPMVFAGFLASIGWSEGQLVVACDGGSNALAGRLWWLMRYFGQPAALLDGGMAAWKEAGLPLETGSVKSRQVPIPSLQADTTMVVSSEQVLRNLGSKDNIVLDARSQERFSGQVALLDTVVGHIPGSINRNMQLNLDSNGKFKNPAILRSEFEALLGTATAAAIVHSCGSGVTACHNLFAMELAEMGQGRLYIGSWSEWTRDASRPIATGN